MGTSAVAETTTTIPAVAAPAPTTVAPVVESPPIIPPAPPVAPTKREAKDYKLSLPKDAVIDAAVLERTAAIASELGLSDEHAQKTLDFLNAETASRVTAEAVAHTAQIATWERETAADPALGKTPEERKLSVQRGQQVLLKYKDRHPEDAKALDDLLSYGLASHPLMVRLFADLGKLGAEGAFIPIGDVAAKPTTVAHRLYGELADKTAPNVA